MRKALLYRDLGNRRVECTACARKCKLSPGQIGFCGVRGNRDGELYLLNYGKIITAHVDPIEKKPLSHFHPGSMVLSIATTGCSWACMYCQNFDISQRRVVEGFEVTPEEVVDLAVKAGAQGVTYTYNEPSIFAEFAHDVGVEAHRRGLFNTFVSNGYLTDEAIDLLSKFLDAITVDFKGNGDDAFARKFILIPSYEPVFNALLELKRKGIYIEVTDLVIPKVGDDLEKARRLVRWIHDNLGPETPLHFLRFHPDYLMMDYPWTPIETLEKHIELAKREGMKYVYIGNVPGHPYEHTYCPSCGNIVIERYGFEIISWRLTKDNRCKFCGEKIPIVGSLHETYKMNRFFSVPIYRLKKFTRIDAKTLLVPTQGSRSQRS
jgi:pyruvate formate lyase activating enzyme